MKVYKFLRDRARETVIAYIFLFMYLSGQFTIAIFFSLIASNYILY